MTTLYVIELLKEDSSGTAYPGYYVFEEEMYYKWAEYEYIDDTAFGRFMSDAKMESPNLKSLLEMCKNYDRFEAVVIRLPIDPVITLSFDEEDDS